MNIAATTPAHVAGFVLTVLLFVTLIAMPRSMSTTQPTLIKRLKPRRYVRMHVELPAPIPPDFSPDEYSDKDLSRMSSDEIESKALAVYSVLTKNCNVTPKRLRGTISYVFDASLQYDRTIIIKCEVPEDAPMEHIRNVLVQTFKGNCTFFV